MKQLTLLLLCIFASTTAMAADCEKAAATLDAQHKQVTEKHTPNTQPYIKALYAAEDQAFTSIKQCKANAHFLAAMADLQLSLGQGPLAVLYAQKSLAINDNNWKAHHVLGTTLTNKEEYIDGLRHLERASSLNPDNYALLINLCSSYEQNFKHNEAIVACGIVIEKGPYELHGPAYYIRARAYTARNEHTLAERDDRLAIEFGFNKKQIKTPQKETLTPRGR